MTAVATAVKIAAPIKIFTGSESPVEAAVAAVGAALGRDPRLMFTLGLPEAADVLALAVL